MIVLHFLAHIFAFDYGLPYGHFGWYNGWSAFLSAGVLTATGTAASLLIRRVMRKHHAERLAQAATHHREHLAVLRDHHQALLDQAAAHHVALTDQAERHHAAQLEALGAVRPVTVNAAGKLADPGQLGEEISRQLRRGKGGDRP